MFCPDQGSRCGDTILPYLFSALHYTCEASSIHRGNFLLPDIPLLENKNYKKMLNFRGIQENMDEHGESFLRWAAAVLFVLIFEGSSRMCSWNTEDEVSLQAPSLSLGAEGWTSSSGNDLKGSIHMSIKSLSWKWWAVKVPQNLWDLRYAYEKEVTRTHS